MAAIKGKNTKPELVVRRFLHSKGLRFRLHPKDLPGKPDIVFRKQKIAVFVHGCFWHGHTDCKHFRLPKTRTDWWKDKINKTIERDYVSAFSLEQSGWKVLTIWECQLDQQHLMQLSKEIYQLKG